MTKLVVDSWAWMELLSGTPKGRTVEKEISLAEEAYTTSVTLAEVISAIARRGRPTDPGREALLSNSRIMVPSAPDAVEAGILHARMKKSVHNMSLAHAFVLQSAQKLGCKVLTGDPDFKEIKEAKFIG